MAQPERRSCIWIMDPVNPGLRNGLGELVVTCQPSVPYQPAERTPDDPAPGQNATTMVNVRAFEVIHLQAMPPGLHLCAEIFASIAAVGPDAQPPWKRVSDLVPNRLPGLALQTTGGRHPHPQHHARGVDERTALPRNIPDLSPVPVTLDALAVQDRPAGLRVAALGVAQANPECVLDSRPDVLPRPSAEHWVQVCHGGKLLGKSRQGMAPVRRYTIPLRTTRLSIAGRPCLSGSESMGSAQAHWSSVRSVSKRTVFTAPVAALQRAWPPIQLTP